MNCVPYGFGTGPYGLTPYGQGPSYLAGGPLPVTSDFDIFCVGPCGPMTEILSYNDVDVTGEPTQLVAGNALEFNTGPSWTWVHFDVIVPVNATFEWTATFYALPPNFSDVVTAGLVVGVTTSNAYSVGLVFSEQGIGVLPYFTEDIYGTLVPESPVQVLADSVEYVPLNTSMTYRMVFDSQERRLYIFATKTSALMLTGHQLVYVLDLPQASDAPTVPPFRVWVGSAQSVWELENICLGSGTFLPVIPPVARVGQDQAIKICSIVQLDGSSSFDPQDLPLSYEWRLVELPETSRYSVMGYDGAAYPLAPHGPPAQFTNKFHSAEMAGISSVEPFEPGDVLVVRETPYTILSQGTDGDGFYFEVDGYVLPDDYVGETFQVIRQYGLSDKFTAKPTFYPDVAGFYRFDLRVSNGQTFSTYIDTVVSALSNATPRGYLPDVSFLWQSLSDFWNLVENKGFIEVIWQAIGMAVSAELLALYQHDYSKSLRDIPQRFQRKWVYYQLRLPELVPEATAIVPVLGYLASSYIETSVDLTGQVLLLEADFPYEVRRYEIPFTGTYTSTQLYNHLNDVLGSLGQFTVLHDVNRLGGGRVRIEAPMRVKVMTGTTASVFLVDQTNTMLQGTGLRIDDTTYLVSEPLLGHELPENAVLCLDGLGYRISRVIDNPLDTWPGQRVVLLDPLPAVVSNQWSIPSYILSLRTDFYTGLVSRGDTVTCEQLQSGEELALWKMPCLGVVPSSVTQLLVDLSNLYPDIQKAADYQFQLRYVTRASYIPVDPAVLEIPYLQPNIEQKNDEEALRENLDFFIDRHRGVPCIRFDTRIWQDEEPVRMLWAEYTYLDNSPTIEGNFGLAVSYTKELHDQVSTADYLSSVRGLWYTYFNGHTLYNLRVGLQIFLGLPFAEEAGIIQSIEPGVARGRTRILILDSKNQDLVRSYDYDSRLDLELNPATGKPYAVGDQVRQFSPLVTGVQVLDELASPGWWRGRSVEGRQTNFIDSFHRFMVRIDSIAFNLQAVLFCLDYVLRLKPKYTHPMFVLNITKLEDVITYDDQVRYRGKLAMYDSVQKDMYGQVVMFDLLKPAAPIPDPDPVDLSFIEVVNLPEVPATGVTLLNRTFLIGGSLSGVQLQFYATQGLSDPNYILEIFVNNENVGQEAFALSPTFPLTLVDLSGSYSFNDGDTVRVQLSPVPPTPRYPAVDPMNASQLVYNYTYVPEPGHTGHTQNWFDVRGPYDGSHPTYVTTFPSQGDPEQYVRWSMDRSVMEPKHNILGSCVRTLPSLTEVTLDDPGLILDLPFIRSTRLSFYETFITHVINSLGNETRLHPEAITVDANTAGLVTHMLMYVLGSGTTAPTRLTARIVVNGGNPYPFDEFIVPFLAAHQSNTAMYSLPAPLTLVPGDVVEIQLIVRIMASVEQVFFFMNKLSVFLVEGESWAFDDMPELAAGTYVYKRQL